MFDLNNMSIAELMQLRRNIANEIDKKLDGDMDYYHRIKKLKNILNSFSNKSIAINIEGDDISMRIEYRRGFIIEFDELDDDANFDINTYNEDTCDNLCIYSNTPNEIEEFYIPLYYDFIATTDSDILRDEPNEKLDYENIELIIKMDSIDYIFTSDLQLE